MSDEHVRRTWIQENTWQCSSCKAENRGRDLRCKNCGSEKEKHEVDIDVVPDPSAAVTDTELLKKAQSGPHWVCKFCQADQWSFKRQCGKCGALQEEQAPPPTQPVRPPRAAVAATAEVPVPSFPHDSFPWALIALGAIGVGAAIWFFIWMLVPHEVRATVAMSLWRHTSYLHERVTKHDEDWGSPADAFNVSCERRIKGQENCHPHDCNAHQERYTCGSHKCNPHSERYTCGGHDCNCRKSCTKSKNGFSSCSEVCSTCPDYCSRTAYDTCSDYCNRTVYDTCYDRCDVYADWCRYDYYAWPIVKQETLNGVGPVTSWPALESNGPTQRLDKEASYSVKFAKGDDAWQYVPNTLDDYVRFSPGATWKVKVNHAGSVWPLQEERR